MTNETKKRIEAYQKALPEMRERVMAVALLLAISIATLSTASFAWLTISRRPEVTDVATTVAANGNLEIALATTDEEDNILLPEESKVGDSSATKGKDIVEANKTWGNLVNLSDSSYGLEHLTLRPAQLNRSSLLVSPLYGAEYQQDGRVEQLNSRFAYATWDTQNRIFMVSDKVGVRAISSTKIEAVGFAEQVLTKKEAAQNANNTAGAKYIGITENKTWMNSLATVMGLYMTAKINASQGDESLTNPTIEQRDVQNLTELFGAFIETYELQFEALAELANYQLFLLNTSEAGSNPYDPVDAEKMMDGTITEETLKKQGVIVTGLTQAKKDFNALIDGYAELDAVSKKGGTIKWLDSGINNIVNSLMNVGICTVDGTNVNNIGVSSALDYISGVHEAKITNGVLYNFENMNGVYCYVSNMSVSAKAKRMGATIPATIKVNISTSAEAPSQFSKDLTYADGLNQGAPGVPVANDTYGLAVDMWVRTNAANSYLTLEGNVITKSEYVRDTGKDVEGNEVELFTLQRNVKLDGEDSEGQSTQIELTLYQKVTTDESGNSTETWHDASNHAIVSLEDGETPTAKMKEVVTVLGFEGENRIWEDANAWTENPKLSLDATTQGGGSCYVYYADTPEDQARSLKLLEAMNVAFVDDKGNLLATAIMDTERFYAENGRVTVPLVLRDDSLEVPSSKVGEDEKVNAITLLEQNVPKRITAIVYLDGMKLDNQDVLAASDIQGKLNIQFGSNITLKHAEDETLFTATRSVYAELDKKNFNYDECIENNTPMKTTVTLTVDGDKPSTVTAFFVRAINSNQGSREEKMVFTPQGENKWTATYTFTSPGNYILRNVELDGQNYDLREAPTVTIEGFTLNYLQYTQGAEGNHYKDMTDAGSSSTGLKLQFASDDEKVMPKVVQGRFLREGDGSAVNVDFTYNAEGVWTGRATFISSGEYKLEYLVLNGEYFYLQESMILTASISLGMKVEIYTDSPTDIRYIPDQLKDNEKQLYMKVKILDNADNEIQALQNAHLYYGMEGSTKGGLDAPLKWDGKEYYTCEFKTTVGVFRFSQVTVDASTITYAKNDTPKFTVRPADPPELAENGLGVTGQTLYSETGDGKMEATFTNSTGSKIMALIRKDVKDTDGKFKDPIRYYVVSEKYDEMNSDPNKDIKKWFFNLPKDVSTTQDGYWTMEELYVWDYYDEEGKIVTTKPIKTDGSAWDFSTQNWIKASDLNFTEENSGISPIDVRKENYWMKIVQTIRITFAVGQSQEFSGNGLLESYSFNGLNVDFTDTEGQPVLDSDGKPLISGVNLTFTYSGNSSSHGGYTCNELTNTSEGAKVTVELKDDGSGSHFVQNVPKELIYAGTYTTSFSYIVNGAPKTDNTKPNMPVFSVRTNKPTVKVTGVSPTGTFNVNSHASAASGGGFTQMSGVSNSFTDYYACVYIRYTGATLGTWRNYAEPSVTLTLSNISSDFENATMTFGHPTASYARTFTFGPGSNLSKTNEIGHADDPSVTDANPRLYYAGKQSVDEITVVRKGMTFNAELSHEVTINQPQRPMYADFEIADSSYTGTVPSRVYSTDQEHIVLPVIENWTNYNVAIALNSKSYPDPTTSSAGTYYYDRGWWRYYTYTRTKYTQSCTVNSEIYDITYKLQWKVGNTLYDPGTEISISEDMKISAVISEVNRIYIETKSVTYTKTWYTYTQTGTSNSGNKISFTPNANTKYDANNNVYDESEVTS